jgi:hypothetical protein
MRVTTKVGDVFRIPLKQGGVRYMQYVANDMTQLNSDVLRVFKPITSNAESDIEKIAESEIDFHVHSDTRAGIKMGNWTKLGRANVYGPTLTLFRQTADDGNPGIKFSTRWSVWRVGESMKFVGALHDANRDSEPGSVFPPFAVVSRIETGDYGFFEHAF